MSINTDEYLIRPVDLASEPIDIAMAFRTQARHLLTLNESFLAEMDYSRLMDLAQTVGLLVGDARRLVGEDQHDSELYKAVDLLRELADLRREKETLIVDALDGLDVPAILDRVSPQT